MKVCYLTWGETPRFSGIFKSQVINQFTYTRKTLSESEFYFLSGLPIIHSGIIREKIKYFDELKKIKNYFKENNINFSIIPVFAPQNFFNSSKATFKYMHFFSQRILKRYLKEIEPDIVHCRSYHATWAALKVREIYGMDYKVVFDARGFWPLEVSYKNRWDKDNLNYQFLKDIESYNLTNSDISIAVSKNMEEYLVENGAKKTDCIYLSTNINELCPDNNLSSVNENDEIVFCYVGALDQGSWHQPQTLFEIYSYLRTKFKKTKMIIATQSNHSKIKEFFKIIPECEIEFTAFKSLNELKQILSSSHFGILSLYNAKTVSEIEQAKGVLAVKFVEYIAGGVAVIVNKQCGEASYLAEKYNIGISYDPNNISIDREKMLSLINNKQQERAKLADKLFSYTHNANRYKSVYLSLKK